MSDKKPDLTQHNHVTRDIKEPGKCPACDAYHERQAEIVGPSYMRNPQVRRWVDEFAIWMRERETWLPQKDAPFWDRLGVHGDLAAHLPIGVNERGQGPVEPDPAHHYECWCGDVDCPLTIALQHAWLAGRRSQPGMVDAEQIRAALRLIGPEHITPTGKRQIEKVLGDE